MKWIEFIRVRACHEALRTAMPTLAEQVREIAGSTPAAETFLLEHALYDGDLALVVVWRNGGPPAKSREGLLVADGLRALGAVDHAVWSPADGIGRPAGRSAHEDNSTYTAEPRGARSMSGPRAAPRWRRQAK